MARCPTRCCPSIIKKDDAVARIRQFVDKRRFFALKEFKEEFTPENVIAVYLPYMIVDAKASADVTGKGEIETRRYTRGTATRTRRRTTTPTCTRSIATWTSRWTT